MKPSLKIRSFLVIFLFLAACNSAPETQPILTKQPDISTPTTTPNPTFTARPTQTHTPIPSPTFTPWPAKEVLIQFGLFGGDGGWDIYAFIGRDTPKLILYTDGQLIVQKEDDNGVWFEETTLTIPQMCSFLSQIEKAGFFDLNTDDPMNMDNPMYEFGDITDLGEGGPGYLIQVNGIKHHQIDIYYKYVPYLIPKVRQVFNLFSNYSPPSKLITYQAQYMLLRIEKGLGDFTDSTPVPVPQTWPAELPSLAVLEKENVETAVSAHLNLRGSAAVLIENEQVKAIFKTFGNRLAYKLFKSGDSIYYVAARPFLPHETLNDFSRPSKEKEISLPFSCDN